VSGQHQEARELVLRIGQKLGQKAMYFEVRYFDGVEILEVPAPAQRDRTEPKKRRKKPRE
jgi:hypothetical protein